MSERPDQKLTYLAEPVNAPAGAFCHCRSKTTLKKVISDPFSYYTNWSLILFSRAHAQPITCPRQCGQWESG
jgi:hypothetical protein